MRALVSSDTTPAGFAEPGTLVGLRVTVWDPGHALDLLPTLGMNYQLQKSMAQQKIKTKSLWEEVKENGLGRVQISTGYR